MVVDWLGTGKISLWSQILFVKINCIILLDITVSYSKINMIKETELDKIGLVFGKRSVKGTMVPGICVP